MVEFLTLFFGLVAGPQLVELSVVGPVASVELRLDGEPLGTLHGEPWAFTFDLGERYLPHDLVAVARDGDGVELDRADQWINMKLQRSAAVLGVRSDEEGRPRALRLDWESIGEPAPEQIEVTLDGQPLPVTDPGDIPLPAPGGGFHYVSASVRFADDLESRRETAFGGARTAEIASELTAVVVHLGKRSSLPAAGKMRTWFLEDGRPLAVHGVEKGPMHLFVVRGPGSQEALDRLAQAVVTSGFRPGHGSGGWQPQHFFSDPPQDVEKRTAQRQWLLHPLRDSGSLAAQLRLHFVSPIPGDLTPGGLASGMFPRSRRYAGSEGGLGWVAQRQPPMSFPPRLATAVALAGMAAHGRNERRAVLLISAGAAEDESELPPRATREYLRALGVPLYVWSLAAEPPDREWGEVVELGDPATPLKTARRLGEAAERLQRDLKKQRVVWLVGRHLPYRIELGPEARGISQAAAEP